MLRSKTIIIILSLVFALAQGCATLGNLSGIGSSSERVEQFPEGEQVNVLIGSMLSGLKDTNTETRVFVASFDRVWQAAIMTSEKLDKIGKRPLTLVDEKNGRISNGVISDRAAFGAGSGAWMDEFLIEVTSIPENKTQVQVTRKVVANEMIAFGNRPGTYGMSLTKWKTRYSNGNIEKWALTQIEDQITNQASGQKTERVPLPKPEASSKPLPKPEATPTISSLAPKEAQAAVAPPPTPAAKSKPAIVAKPPIAYLVVIKTVNVRTEASVKSKIITTIKKGEKVEKLDKSGNWFKIKLSSGEIGWVFKDLVKEAE